MNNAGIAIQDQMVDDLNLDEQKYNQQWQVNVMGSIAVTRAAAPKLKDGRRIIIVGSLLGDYIPFKGH
ncbi:SDR family NAD(P)-dependent oxidoreductase [Paenibacillus sp. FSL R7-0198]|uniref:SDR family NAD(P)-dependent oxidoreductase n=1 Tax=Paenibacillus sp. FSL R7-0198 TaxID=2921674 RepID=UPI004046E403